MTFGDETGHDAHCRRCGSLLYSLVRDGALVHVTMGTLVDEPSIRPTVHIFVGSKAPWYTITDDLPQHEGHAVAAGASRRLGLLPAMPVRLAGQSSEHPVTRSAG